MPIRTAAATLVLLAVMSWGNWPVAAPAPPQDPSTDVGLETASNGRTVRIGALSGAAAVAVVPLEVLRRARAGGGGRAHGGRRQPAGPGHRRANLHGGQHGPPRPRGLRPVRHDALPGVAVRGERGLAAGGAGHGGSGAHLQRRARRGVLLGLLRRPHRARGRRLGTWRPVPVSAGRSGRRAPERRAVAPGAVARRGPGGRGSSRRPWRAPGRRHRGRSIGRRAA